MAEIKAKISLDTRDFENGGNNVRDGLNEMQGGFSSLEHAMARLGGANRELMMIFRGLKQAMEGAKISSEGFGTKLMATFKMAGVIAAVASIISSIKSLHDEGVKAFEDAGTSSSSFITNLMAGMGIIDTWAMKIAKVGDSFKEITDAFERAITKIDEDSNKPHAEKELKKNVKDHLEAVKKSAEEEEEFRKNLKDKSKGQLVAKMLEQSGDYSIGHKIKLGLQTKGELQSQLEESLGESIIAKKEMATKYEKRMEPKLKEAHEKDFFQSYNARIAQENAEQDAKEQEEEFRKRQKDQEEADRKAKHVTSLQGTLAEDKFRNVLSGMNPEQKEGLLKKTISDLDAKAKQFQATGNISEALETQIKAEKLRGELGSIERKEEKDENKRPHFGREIQADSFARIGLFARATGAVGLTYQQQTAQNTKKILEALVGKGTKHQPAIAG